MEKLNESGLEVTPENEKMMREKLRAEYGMAAYATLSLPKIEEYAKTSNVVLDGLYSWDELKYHLATVGPVGASIKGDTGIYKTGGHLIVVVGYKEVGNNKYVSEESNRLVKTLEELKKMFIDQFFHFQLKWASSTLREKSYVDPKFLRDTLLRSILQTLPDNYLILYYLST